MQKIVINKCFGGFGLSPVAVLKLGEKKGLKLYPYQHCYIQRCYKRASDNLAFTYYSTKDLGEETETIPSEYFFSKDNIDRSDPDLVDVIEELGVDRASGLYANLKIVEIPDDVEWIITDYDGIEQVEEKHRVWY